MSDQEFDLAAYPTAPRLAPRVALIAAGDPLHSAVIVATGALPPQNAQELRLRRARLRRGGGAPAK